MGDKKREYPVGYCKPPASKRFKKGISGNPRGRPKIASSFESALERELRQSVVVIEQGLRQSISKRTAISKRLVNNALSGDRTALKLLVEMLLQQDKKTRRQEDSPVLCEQCQFTAPASREELERRLAELLGPANLALLPKDHEDDGVKKCDDSA